jgi:hypothetical protein
MYLVLLGKAATFVPVELFRIAATLGKPNGWLVTLCMGIINCHALWIVGVSLGDGGVFVLGASDAVAEEQIVTLA